MPTVLVTGPTVTQNSPFSSLLVAVTIANTHFTYPQTDDQAELAWVTSKTNITADTSITSFIQSLHHL